MWRPSNGCHTGTCLKAPETNYKIYRFGSVFDFCSFFFSKIFPRPIIMFVLNFNFFFFVLLFICLFSFVWLFSLVLHLFTFFLDFKLVLYAYIFSFLLLLIFLFFVIKIWLNFLIAIHFNVVTYVNLGFVFSKELLGNFFFFFSIKSVISDVFYCKNHAQNILVKLKKKNSFWNSLVSLILCVFWDHYPNALLFFPGKWHNQCSRQQICLVKRHYQ